jgi:hypothetical protein
LFYFYFIEFQAVNTQERKMNEFNNEMDVDCSFHTANNNNFVSFVQFTTPVNLRTKRKSLCQKSFTFIGELASTSTPTSKKYEPITSTPNVSTHNPLNYHPTYTIRNKKMKASQQQSSKKITARNTRNYACLCKCHDTNCTCDFNRKQRKLAKRMKQQQQLALKPTHVQISIQDLLYMPDTNASLINHYQAGKIYYI